MSEVYAAAGSSIPNEEVAPPTYLLLLIVASVKYRYAKFQHRNEMFQ
jgi:hypothetical protein